MKYVFLRIQLCSCFLIVIFFTSCKGQDMGAMHTNNTANLTMKGKPKLTKNGFYDEFKEAAGNVHCGLQDKSGNMWFGTTGNGIYQYNGKSFINFTMRDGLNSNCVWSMLEDTAGNIWIGTDAGLCFYDGKEITDVPIEVNAEGYIYGLPSISKKSPGRNEVFSIIQDKHGTIWVGTTEGVFCYNHNGKPDGRFFTRFLENGNVVNKSRLTLKSVQCMLEDKKGNVWFGSGPMAFEGIAVFDGQALNNFRPKDETWIRNIFEDREGTIWFGTRHYGGLRYDGKSFAYFDKKEHIGNPMLQDRNGTIWFSGDEKIGTVENEGGIWCYDGRSFKNFNIKDGISKYSVFCMVADGDQNIWIGTRNSGLYKYDGKIFTSLSD